MAHATRPIRLDIEDMQVFTDLLEFDRCEGEPVRVPEDRLKDYIAIHEDEDMTWYGMAVDKDGAPVGMGSFISRGFPEGSGMLGFHVVVHPEHRRSGIGRCLVEVGGAEAKQLGYAFLMTAVREENTEGRAFLQSTGFEEVDRTYQLEFKIKDWSETRGRELLDTAADRGIRILSLGEMEAQDPCWLEKLHELCIAFRDDLPTDMEAFQPIPDDVDSFSQFMRGQKVDADGSFVAIMDDMPVATAWLFRVDEGAEFCGHAMTGVRREYRRRGLVKLLKQAGFAWAREVGVNTIYTSQNHSNEAMLSLNQGLGFRIMIAYLVYRGAV